MFTSEKKRPEDQNNHFIRGHHSGIVMLEFKMDDLPDTT